MLTPILAVKMLSDAERALIVQRNVEDMMVPEWLQYLVVFALVVNTLYIVVWTCNNTYYAIYPGSGKSDSVTASDTVFVTVLNLIPITLNIICVSLLLMGYFS